MVLIELFMKRPFVCLVLIRDSLNCSRETRKILRTSECQWRGFSVYRSSRWGAVRQYMIRTPTLYVLWRTLPTKTRVTTAVSCALCVLEGVFKSLMNCTDPCVCSCHSPTLSGKESAMCSRHQNRKMGVSHLKTFWTSWVHSVTRLLWKSNPTTHSAYLVNVNEILTVQLKVQYYTKLTLPMFSYSNTCL